ncbi:alpha beta hydrolase fold protein [Ramaria rubella]|nr:alpha beta hydrolase fold protein [Ramaria rubella]
MAGIPQTQYYHHGTLHLAGGTLPDAVTAYRTHGDPANPCIVFPTCYGARLDDQYYMVGNGPNHTLDTTRYFVVTFALFSNGESSSPSNTPVPHNGPYFPKVSYKDNINAQHAVLTHLGIKKIFCVVGFSMGGQQAYHWAYMYPDMVERFIPICGSARTSPHNKCFIEGPKAALLASRDFEYGHYKTPPVQGIRAFGRVYSAWAYGQTWFRTHSYLSNGKYKSLESFLLAEWETAFLDWDAHDLITLINTWSEGDISNGGDLEKALGSVKARGLIMPSKTDLYFPPEDSVHEVEHLPNAELVVMETVWGHMAGGGACEEDVRFMRERIGKFLRE